MIPPGMDVYQLLGGLVASLLTFLVFFYTLGDNPLFRIAIFVFIGVAAGYAGGVAWHSVIIPHLLTPLLTLGNANVSLINLLFRMMLILLLLTKISSRIAFFGNPAMALLVGVGSAAVIGGAIQGTIFPLTAGSGNIFEIELIRQALASGDFFSLLELIFIDGSVFLIGTLATLIYFHFGARSKDNQIPQRNRAIELVGKIGQGFIAITFGALFAGVYLASINALIERFFFIWNFLNSFLLG